MPIVGLKPPRKEDVLSGQGDARQNFYYHPAFHLSSHLEEGGEMILKPKRIFYRRFILCGAKAPQKGRCPFRTGRRTEKCFYHPAFLPSSQLEEGGEIILSI